MSCKIKTVFSCIVFSFLTYSGLIAQIENNEKYSELFNEFKKKYNIHKTYVNLYSEIENLIGFDQILANGKYYENRYYKALGHPFLGEDEFKSGRLIFRNKKYDNVELKYNIYDQQIVINYTLENRRLWIILPNEFITSFEFDNRKFVTDTLENELLIFQSIGNNNELNCYYHWGKKRDDSDHLKTHTSYEFSKEKKKTYLKKENILFKYSGNNSFIKLFPDEIQKEILKYIKSNKLKVKKSEDEKINKLLDFCISRLDLDKNDHIL